MISIAIRMTSILRSLSRPPSSTREVELLTEGGFVLTTESGLGLITE